MLDVPEKHRSLEAAFNYSWHRLEKKQQDVLIKLSVYRGGFTRQAAEQMTGIDWMTLTELLNKSLIHRTSDGRINLHRVILNFSNENLKENAETSDEVYEKHSRYYIRLLQDKETDLLNEKITVTREEIRPEIENLRAALNWAVLNWDADSALEAVRSYFTFYLVHGWYDGVIALDQLAAFMQMHGDIPTKDNPAYLSCRVHQAWFCSNLTMIEDCEKISREYLQPVKALGMQRELAICFHNLGGSAEFRGEYGLSKELLEKSIRVGRKHPFNVFPSFHLWLGYVHFLLGEYEEGMRCFKESYSLFIKDDNIWGSSFALSKMGLAADGLGDHAAAMKYFKEAYKIFMDIGDVTGQAYSLSRMSIGAYFLEDYKGAIDFGEQAVKLFKSINHVWGTCASLGHLGFTHLRMGEIKRAQNIFYDSLELTSDSEMVPLSLYALAGIACTRVKEGNEKGGTRLFKYIQSHPKTPALYVEVAKHFLQDQGKLIPSGKQAKDDAALLKKVIRNVMEERKYS